MWYLPQGYLWDAFRSYGAILEVWKWVLTRIFPHFLRSKHITEQTKEATATSPMVIGGVLFNMNVTLNMLDCFKNYKIYIYILNHILVLSDPSKLD